MLLYVGPFILLLIGMLFLIVLAGAHNYLLKFLSFSLWLILCAVVSLMFFRFSYSHIMGCSINAYRFWLVAGGISWCLAVEFIAISVSFVFLGGVGLNPHFVINIYALSDIAYASRSTLLIHSAILIPIHLGYSSYLNNHKLKYRSDCFEP